MEIEVKDHHVSTKDDLFEEFQCCICLDLLYKPVVVACGHMACFWCIFKAMDFCEECPVCRTPYNYFPRICRLLHLILRKLYPLAYARREKEVSEEEEKSGNVSQQFDDLKHEASDFIICEHPSDSQKGVKLSSETAREVGMHQNGDGPTMECIVKLVSLIQVMLYVNVLFAKPHIQMASLTSVGFSNISWSGDSLKNMQLEGSLHWNMRGHQECGVPICLHLCNVGSNKPAHSSSSASAYSSWLSGQGPVVHFAGCDYCGMCPIIGKRYICKDCKGKMSFDLCEGCYNSSCKLPGRFNQQHTEDYQFEMMEPTMVDVIRMFAAGNGLDDQTTFFNSEGLNPQESGTDQARELEEGGSDQARELEQGGPDQAPEVEEVPPSIRTTNDGSE